MKFHTALLLFFGIGIQTFAQKENLVSHKSKYTYVYKLTDEEVLNLHWYKKKRKPESYLHTLVDSVLTKDRRNGDLKPGYYFFVYTDNNDLEMQEYIVSHIHPRLIDNGKDFQLMLYDEEGNKIKDAEVYFNDRRIMYDAALEIYLQKGLFRKGFLKVYYRGEFLFEEVTPYRYNKKRSLFYRMTVEPLRLRKDKRNLRRDIAGYLVTDKPMYRFDDTVRLKGIVYRKNRLYRRKLPLYFVQRKTNGNSTNEVKSKLGIIRPDRDGNYLFKFRLTDTLQIDKRYKLLLSNGKLFMDTEFFLRDYRLEDYTYNASLSEEPLSGDTVSLQLSAYDVLGNPLHGGKATIRIVCGGVKVVPEMPSFLSFDVLDTMIDLSEEKSRLVKILPETFPYLSADYMITVKFQDANNHAKEEEIKFSYTRPREKFVVEAKGDSTEIRFEREGKVLPVRATLWMETYLEKFQKEVHFPFTILSSHDIVPTRVTYKGKNFSLQKIEEDALEFEFEKNDKSIALTAINPDSIKFRYNLYGNGKLIVSGYSTVLNYRKTDSGIKRYKLETEYFWDGKYKNLTKYFPQAMEWGGYKVETNFPTNVAPGETIRVKAKISGRNDKAMKNLNITAGAVDAKFQAVHIPTLKPGKISRRTLEEKKLILTHSSPSVKGNPPAEYQKLFHMDTVLYYKFTHPGAGHFYYYTKIDTGHSEFAPHVFINGAKRWIYYILVDGKPIYFSHNEYLSNTSYPYSFRIPEGYHSVTIRTSGRLIELDSIYVKKGCKLDLSIDGNYKGPNRQAIQRKKEYPSAREFAKLKLKELTIRNNYSSHIVVSTQYSDVKVENTFKMILVDSDPIVIMRNGEKENIVIEDSLSLLEVHSTFFFKTYKKGKPNYTPIGKSYYSAQQDPGQTLADLYKPFTVGSSGETVIDLFTYYSGSATKAGYGSFFLNSVPIHDYKTYELKNIHDSSLNYTNSLPVLYNINPGLYLLTVFDDSSQRLRKDSVLIKANTLTTVDLDSIRASNVVAKWDSPLSKTDKKYTLSYVGIKEYPSGYYQGADYSNILYSSLDYGRETSFRPIGRFNRRYKYISFGGGFTFSQWDSRNAGFDNPVFPSMQAFVARRYSSYVSAELNLQYLYAYSRYRQNRYHTDQLAISAFAYIDVIRHRGRYQKRPDFIPFLKTGISVFTDLGTYHRVGTQKVYNPSVFPIQPMVPVGVGLRYKLSKQLDLRISASRYFSLLGTGFGRGRAIGNFNQTEISLAYIIPSRVVCPRFRGDISGQRYYSAPAELKGNYISAQSIMLMKSVKLEPGETIILPETSQGASTRIRSHFNDVAYWQPTLKTDKNGQVEFSVTFPEDITLWKNYMLGLGKNNRKFTHVSFLPAILPVSVKLNTPRFAILGDEFTTYGNLLNYTGQTQKINYALHAGSQKTALDTSFIRTLSIPARLKAIDADTMKITAEILTENKSSDGELTKLPVLYPGMLESKGNTWVTSGDTTIQIKTDGIVNGKLSFSASRIDEMLSDIENLKKYPYACMEQTASKLKGLLLLKSIYQKQQKDFKEDPEIYKLLEKLEKGQKENGSWGWWASTQTDLYVTSYILKTVTKAVEMGYHTKSLGPAREFLKHFRLDEILSYDVLLTMSELGIPVDSLNMKRVLKPGTNLTELQKIQRIRILQLNKYPYSIAELLALKKTTIHGGIYFGYESYHWATNATQATLLAYKILEAHKGHKEELEKIVLYFYGIKEEGYWRNTVETAMIVDLLLTAQKDPLGKTTPTIKVNNKTIPSLPYSLEVHKDSVCSVTYSATQPVYTSFYTTVWSENVHRHPTTFNVQTILKKDGNPVTTMKAGEIYELQVTVKADKRASYLMLEVPVPAGCLHADKKTPGYYETYRENFKEKTNIYMGRLEPGDYSFSVFLTAAYPGTYTLNPAKISMMYFPAVFGNEEVKKVEIQP